MGDPEQSPYRAPDPPPPEPMAPIVPVVVVVAAKQPRSSFYVFWPLCSSCLLW
jgi:hypothetical protein